MACRQEGRLRCGGGAAARMNLNTPRDALSTGHSAGHCMRRWPTLVNLAHTGKCQAKGVLELRC